MNKKNSKYLVVLAAMVVFSILLASCQSMLATTEETEINRAVEAWGANLTAQGESFLERMERQKAMEALVANSTAYGKSYYESYLEEMEQASVPWIELRSDVPFESEEMQKVSVPLIELRSDVPFESEEKEQVSVPLIELRSDVPSEAEEMVAALTIGGENYYESYLEEMEQASIPLVELRSDVPAEAEVMVAAYSPGIKINRTWLEEKTFLTVYTVMSDGPAWVVFHADEDNVPGKILQKIWVSGGTSSITRTEELEEMSSEKIHVMLHQDLARIGEFEFPTGPDGPVFVDNAIVNELCFCPY